MVGLVLVAHSHSLAQALLSFICQASPQEIPVQIAAGVGPERSELGTDAVEIASAIQAVDSPEGVLVLVDIGSALISAETALDLLPAETAARVVICPAPLVEGGIAAAVQVGLGSDLQTVYREAVSGLQAKQEALGSSLQDANITASVGHELAGQARVEVEVVNEHGLHARPAVRFIQLAAGFNARVQVENLMKHKGPVSARSLTGLTSLGAVRGDRLQIIADGPQARIVLDALSGLVMSGFGESLAVVKPPEPACPAAQQLEQGQFQGLPVSDGYAIGSIFQFRLSAPIVPDTPSEGYEIELQRLGRAIEVARRAIQDRQAALARSEKSAQVMLFDAHVLLLDDPAMLEAAQEHLRTGLNAAQAWQLASDQAVQELYALDDPYFQQRAVDVEDVCRQVLSALGIQGKVSLPVQDSPIILVAQDLAPSDVASLDLKRIVGLATLGGSATSHSAILARSLGIPAVTGLDRQVEGIMDGEPAILNGSDGLLWVNPPAGQVERARTLRVSWLERRQRLISAGQGWAVTRSGRRVEVAANVGSLADARTAFIHGADSIGILRTEFLYLGRQDAPSETEQYLTLCQIGEAMGGRPVIVRTLDVGGDKFLPYIPMPHESNPYLGVRAIRLCFKSPGLFLDQLKAVLRAGARFPLKLILPMVASVEEVREIHRWLERARQRLDQEGKSYQWPLECGIMVEIPSAALTAMAIAPYVDFFSLGTNDLTQYTLAAERGNPQLAHLADGLHPAVLRLIKMVVDAAHAHGKWAGVCGELAGDPVAAAVLVGIGVDELSLNPNKVPVIKSIVRQLDDRLAEQLAKDALDAENARAVRDLGGPWMKENINCEAAG